MNTSVKYGLTFTCNSEEGTRYSFYEKRININPERFTKDGIEEIFWHEVGHHVVLHNKRIREGMCKRLGIPDRLLLAIDHPMIQWINELYAWRFAAKVMGKRFNSDIMYQGLGSYIERKDYESIRDDCLRMFKYHLRTLRKENK